MILQKILLAMVLGALWAANSAAAQSDKDPPKSPNARFGDPTTMAQKYQDYLYGVIKEVSADQMVLTKTKYGSDQAFKFNKKTKFVEDGKPSSASQLRAGDKVWVAVDKSKKTGDLTAKRVVAGTDIPAIP
jgi:hypothetical protein